MVFDRIIIGYVSEPIVPERSGGKIMGAMIPAAW